MRKVLFGGLALIGVMVLGAIAGGDKPDDEPTALSGKAEAPKLVSSPLTLEVRTLTTEGMLLNAADKTRDALAEIGQVAAPITIEYVSSDDGAGLFSLTWDAEKVNNTDWRALDDWAALNDASQGKFITVAGSRPIAAWCGQGIQTGMFGPAGSNPGYFEGFCRLMTSNSLPWAEYDGSQQ